MKKLVSLGVVMFLLLFVCICCVHAQMIVDAPEPVEVEELDVDSVMDKLPGANQGFVYSMLDREFSYVSTIDLIKYKHFLLKAGYAPDRLVGAVTVDLLSLKELGVDVPILDLINVEPGIFGGFSDLDSRAEFDWGFICDIIKVKF